ncbi:hypothetical protein [Bradyrhizobium sp. AZCC 2230]
MPVLIKGAAEALQTERWQTRARTTQDWLNQAIAHSKKAAT